MDISTLNPEPDFDGADVYVLLSDQRSQIRCMVGERECGKRKRKMAAMAEVKELFGYR